jgi:DnaJ-class molecular chaperone
MSEHIPVKERVNCMTCNGYGYVAEHAGDNSCQEGKCVNCPIQKPCPTCHGVGYFEYDRDLEI